MIPDFSPRLLHMRVHKHIKRLKYNFLGLLYGTSIGGRIDILFIVFYLLLHTVFNVLPVRLSFPAIRYCDTGTVVVN